MQEANSRQRNSPCDSNAEAGQRVKGTEAFRAKDDQNSEEKSANQKKFSQP